MVNLSIGDTVANVFNSICQGIATVINFIFSLLPENPFEDITVPAELTEILGFMNYFLPVKAFIVVLAAWLGAIVLIIIYKLLYSFFKIIGF